MVATAAHLTDHVLPPLPVRQWVLVVPKRLRYFLQGNADLQGAALRLFLRVVEQHLRTHSPGSGPAARLGGKHAYVAASRRPLRVNLSTGEMVPFVPATFFVAAQPMMFRIEE